MTPRAKQPKHTRAGRAFLTCALAVLLAGVALVAYPTVSNWYNQAHATRAVGTYTGAVEDQTAAELAQIRAAAQAYNAQLAGQRMNLQLDDAATAAYNALLSVPGTDVMATIEIPTLGVALPVYHGVTDTSLRAGVGHMPGTSLPVVGTGDVAASGAEGSEGSEATIGSVAVTGEDDGASDTFGTSSSTGAGSGTASAGTHTVLVGHRGLPEARLFTDLDKLRLGDTFCVSALGQEAWYEVDQILTVEPQDVSALAIEPGRDLCTLVTCTPYGINSHRLLVRGHRVEGPETSTAVTADAFRLNALGVACAMSLPVLGVLAAVWAARRRNAQRRARRRK
jgi:sortase A